MLQARQSPALGLFFVQIFTGHIILRHLVRVNFLLISIISVFHPHHCVGFERIPFLA